ncbi:unnamed protein product [Closterium sp. Naga37s-1]|nr:unnamed protein product [Closterium sp. Naga37s-1]
MAEIPQFDEVMELTDEDLEAMELPDDPAGSNLPRTRSPTELPASKKPCVDADPSSSHDSAAATSGVMEGPAGTPEKPVMQTTSTNASAAAGVASAPSVADPALPAPSTPGPSSSTPIGPAGTADTNATAIPSVEMPPEPELPRSSRQPAPPPPTLPPPILMTSSRSVVTLLFPEAGADAIRATLISKILAKLKPSLFDCGFVPDARPTNGETLRFAGRSYATICFSWPTEQSAREFLPIFNHPIELAHGRSILVKSYVDPHPDFTTAKAIGAPVLSLRRVPPRFDESNLLTYLVPRWLAGINSFHRMQDPYDGVFLNIFSGIPIPLAADPEFRSIPALIPVSGNELAILRRLMACYADDVTLFLTSDTELGLAVILLGVFGSVSGEVPNWNKCSIIPFNISPTDLAHAGPIPVRAPSEA